MAIISVEILKIINERESCDTRCVVMRWSSIEAQLRQQKMPIISAKDNKSNRWKRNARTNKQKKQDKGDGICSERGRDKWFCWAFELGFLQLTWKASLIFISKLELALTTILKERELYESKYVVVECKCLKIWDLLSFLICFWNLVLKWRHISPIWLKLQLAQVNLYTRKDL